jgi:hypothetical protein
VFEKMKILKRIDLYALFLFVLVLGVSLSVVNISAPLTEGWWHVYARWIAQGRIPYKDFELLVPPGYPYLIWVLTHFVGEQFLHLRILGSLLESVIAVQLFYIFKGLVGKFLAFSLAFFGTVYLYSGTASITYDYHYFAVFFLLGAGLLLQKSNFFTANVFSKTDSRLYVAAGFCIALSSLIKQTYAISFALFIFFYFAVRTAYKYQLWKILMIKLAYLLAPWILTLSFVSFYFSINGAFSQMIQQIFSGALEVKGSADTVAFAWLNGLWNPYWISYNIRAVLVFVFVCFIASRLLKRWTIFKNTTYSETLTLAFASSVFVVALMLLRINDLNLTVKLPDQIWKSLYEVMFLAPLLVLAYMFLKFRNSDSLWVPLIVLAFAFVWGNGMSAGLTEYGTFLSSITAFAFIAALFDVNRIVSLISLSIVFICSTVMYGNRLVEPYSWWGYSTPSVGEATVASEIGLTKGLRFSKAGYREFKEVNNKLKTLSCKGEVIGYPHMPIFALDADRIPNGTAAIYWYDFVQQGTLLRESTRLKDNPFSALIRMDTKETAEQHQRLFEIVDSNGRQNFTKYVDETVSTFKIFNYSALKIELATCRD